MSKKKALVVHTGGGLGDVLLSGPVVDSLDSAGYQVDFLARESTAIAVERHPKLHELLTIPSKDPRKLKDIKHWVGKLKKREYDTCLLLWCTTRWAWTIYNAGIPVRVGQDSRLTSSFLFTHKVSVRSEKGDEESHWTDILLDYVRALGIEPVTPKVSFPVTSNELDQAQKLIEEHDFGELQGPLLGFHSGKGLPLSIDRWPVEQFAAFARELQHSLQAKLILTGGPAETEIVSEVSRRLTSPHLNLAGKTSLPILAAVTKLCQAYICPDSGPMHLSAAVGTPVVGIYALDEDFPKRWAPFDIPHRVVRPPRPACPPGCRKPTCQDFACYLKVRPESLTQELRELLPACE